MRLTVASLFALSVLACNGSSPTSPGPGDGGAASGDASASAGLDGTGVADAQTAQGDGAAEQSDGSITSPNDAGGAGQGEAGSLIDAGSAGDASTTGGGDASGDSSAGDAAPSFVPSDPFTIDTTRPPISFAQLAAYLPAGSTGVTHGTFTVVSRTRQCAAVTGCAAWSSRPAVVDVMDVGNVLACARVLIAGGTPSLTLTTTSGPFIRLLLPSDVPTQPAGEGTCTEEFSLGFVWDDPDSGAGDLSGVGAINDVIGHGGVLLFPSAELNVKSPDDTSLELSGRINDDGTFQAVSVLGYGSSITYGANEESQVAVYGQL